MIDPTSTTWQDLRDRAVGLCRAVLPHELPDATPFYVALSSELPAEMPGGTHTAGYVLDDLVLRPHLGAR